MTRAGMLTWGPLQAGPEHRQDWSTLEPSPGAGGQCPAESWPLPSTGPPAPEWEGCLCPSLSILASLPWLACPSFPGLGGS